MKKAFLTSLPDVLDAKDIAKALGIGYVKSLHLIRYGNLPYIKVGRVYKVSKQNFIEWLNSNETRIIELD